MQLWLMTTLMRLLAKRRLNGNYDPAAFRKAMAKASKIARPVEQRGDVALEPRGELGGKNTILYIPGGGFMFGADDSHRGLVDELCRRTAARGWILHHRLAPEHAFPAAFDDAVQALAEVLSTPRTGAITVVADSAGASLALVATATRRAAGLSAPDRIVLLSPLTDLAMTGLSNVYNRNNDPLFGPEALIHKAHHYLQGANPTDPRVSPLWGDLAGLPPLQIFVGSLEVMLDDSTRLADKVRKAGGEVDLMVCPGAPHDYPLYLPKVPESRQARDAMVAFIAAGMPDRRPAQ